MRRASSFDARFLAWAGAQTLEKHEAPPFALGAYRYVIHEVEAKQ
ncbi:MAG: hypothetical protein ACYCWW_19930 [Deltaproteobacteria bacterium]